MRLNFVVVVVVVVVVIVVGLHKTLHCTCTLYITHVYYTCTFT